MSRFRAGLWKGARVRALGLVFMVIGLLILMLCVPYWVWTAALSVLLILIGFLAWRFSCT